MISNIVGDPRGFFSKQIMYPGARTQLFIACAVGVAFLLQHVGAYLLLGDVAVELYEVIALNVIIEFAGPIGLWFVSTFLIVVASRILIGRVRFGDVFRLVGWGLLPLVAAGLVQSAGRVFALRGATAPELGMYSYIEYEWEQYLAFFDTATGDPAFVVATVIAALVALYTGYLWMLAVEEIGTEDGYDPSRAAAALAVAVPTAVCVLWVLRPFVL